MESGKSCEGCGSRKCCQSIYQRLRHAKGPSVTVAVLTAFGIPILVFIVTLALMGAWLERLAEGASGPMLLAFVIAVAVTAVVVLVIWKIAQRPAEHEGEVVLLIYHSVKGHGGGLLYRVGVALLNRKMPHKMIARSSGFVFQATAKISDLLAVLEQQRVKSSPEVSTHL